MTSTNIKFPVASFRRIESPFDDSVARTYVAIVRVIDLPKEFEEWRKINARDPKLTSGVSKKIRASLEENPDQFLFRNRGITLLAEKTFFDNKTNEATLEMVDHTRNGLLDGGHTYAVLRDFVESTDEKERNEINACVRLEIIEGIQNLDDAVSIVYARNTSAQVKEEGLEELLQHFATIKEVLKGKIYADRIAYKEYELDANNEPKDIEIKDILSYLICFDSESFGREKHPIIAYSGKTDVVKHFKANRERLEKYIQVLPEILDLRDEIYFDLPEAYIKATGGKFGALTGVTYIKSRPKMRLEELPFSDKKSSYRIPSAFIYPVLAAFRNLIRIKDDRIEWKENPIRFYQSVRKEIATRICEQALQMRNPTKLGKDSATWGRCYDLVELETLQRGLK